MCLNVSSAQSIGTMSKNYEFVFNADMYTDCAQYSTINASAARACATVSSIGGLIALLVPPTIAFAIISESLLIFAFTTRCNRTAKQHIYATFECILNISFAVYICGIEMWLSRGQAWLGYDSFFFFTNKHRNACRGARFAHFFIVHCLNNILFADILNRAFAIKCKCYMPITSKKWPLMIIYCILSSIVTNLPQLIVSSNWVLDGREYCEKDPLWSPNLLFWIGSHEFLIACGMAHSIGIAFLIVAISRGLGKLDCTINYLHSAFRLPAQVTETLSHVIYIMREMHRDCWVSVIYTALSALLFMVKSGVRGILNYEVYRKSWDNGTPRGALKLYTYWALDDLVNFLYLLLIAHHFWLYFFFVPQVRVFICGDTSERATRKQKLIEKFIPVDPDSENFQTMWDSSIFYNDKGNPALYDRLSVFQNILYELQNEQQRKEAEEFDEPNAPVVTFGKRLSSKQLK